MLDTLQAYLITVVAGELLPNRVSLNYWQHILSCALPALIELNDFNADAKNNNNIINQKSNHFTCFDQAKSNGLSSTKFNKSKQLNK